MHSVFGFEVELVVRLHVGCGIPGVHVAHRVLTARGRGRVRIGQHLSAQRVFASYARISAVMIDVDNTAAAATATWKDLSANCMERP